MVMEKITVVWSSDVLAQREKREVQSEVESHIRAPLGWEGSKELPKTQVNGTEIHCQFVRSGTSCYFPDIKHF